MVELLVILKKLDEAGIKMTLKAEDLEVSFFKELSDDSLIDLIRNNKEEIKIHLKNKGLRDRYIQIPVAQSAAAYPISFAQRRLWIISQLQDASVSYNIPAVIRLSGSYNVDYFNKAINEVINRHEILRTTFRQSESGEVQQYIRHAGEMIFTIKFLDLTDFPDKEVLADSYIREDSYKPFDLENGPLIRGVLYKLDEDSFILYYNMHHIISDGWSKDIMFKEVLAFYSSYVTADKIILPDLRIQYKDYAVWQLGQVESDLFAGDKIYWEDKLSGELLPLNLPAYQSRPLFKTYNGASFGTCISSDIASKLMEFSKNHDGSLFMVLVASLKALFYKYTTQEDIIVGSPIAGREHTDLENQIGFYVNTVVLRDEVTGTDNFNNLFLKVRQTCLDAYSHQMYPFDQLVEDLDLVRDTSRSVLFDVMIILQHTDDNKDDDEESTFVNDDQLEDYGPRACKFDLLFSFKKAKNGLFMLVEYNTDIYDPETIKGLLRHYKYLLYLMLESPDMPLALLDYLSAEEKLELLTSFNNTDVKYPVEETFLSLFEEQATRSPESIAITFSSRELTYREVSELSNQLAHFLREKYDIQADDLIGIMLERSEWLIISILGVLKSGAAYIPIDPNYPQKRIESIIGDSKLPILITDNRNLDLANKLQWECALLHTFICIDSDDVYQYHDADNDDRASEQLWDFVGETAVDEITSGGWISSYTGLPFSVAEMEEYKSNIYTLLKEKINKDIKVLEIGCSSGLTLRVIAPFVGQYIGTDISPGILAKLQISLKEEGGYENTRLIKVSAFDIEQINESEFDLIIINSVVQYFGKHNYLRNVLKKVMPLLKTGGHLFVGDVMDQDLKDEMIVSLTHFSKTDHHKEYITKLDFSTELFLSKDFFFDLQYEYNDIAGVTIRNKEHTISNELTKYRYDALLTKGLSKPEISKKKKAQIGVNDIQHYTRDAVSVLINEKDLAYVIYTSGSTGKPKGVMVEHRNVNSFFENLSAKFSFSPGQVIGAATNFTFDISVLELLGSLVNGLTIFLFEDSDPELLVQSLSEGKLNVLQLTPSRLAQLTEERDITLLDKLDVLLIGGEALNKVMFSELMKLTSTKIFNVYGPTETTIWSTALDLRSSTGLSIGSPLLNEQIYILDSSGSLVPKAVAGEIYIGGAGVARGYLNRPDLTEEKFTENRFKPGQRIYRTGDLGRWLQNGNVEFMGRDDDQVKIRGYRIELGEIETALLSEGIIEEAVVIARETGFQEKELVAYIVSGISVNISDLKIYLRTKLPDYMLPSHFIQLDQLPLTSSGKINKKSLPLSEEGDSMRTKTYLPPGNDMERKLMLIWSEVLGREMISITDDFFELGGHSLKATRLLSKYHKAFDVKLSLKELFIHKDIAAHAALLSSSEKEVFYRIDKIAESTSYELSDGQRRLWILSQFEEGSKAYNIPQQVELNEIYDVEIFKKSVHLVVERHEILRTVFRENETGEVRQYIVSSEASGFVIDYLDFREVDNNNERSQQYIIEYAYKPFDLHNGPLLRAALLQLSESRYIFYYSMHHIISDGWSMNVLARDVMAYYKSLTSGEELSLPSLYIQYKDYSSWQINQVNNSRFGAHKRYWQQKLSGEIAPLSLPGYQSRPLFKTYNGASLTTYLSADLTRQLRQFGQRHGGSLFMVLVASIKSIFYRYTSQNDIVIGSPIAGREHNDLENQIGFYVNTLVLRDHIIDTDTFEDIFTKVSQTCIEAYAHQEYPFDRLVEDLNIERDTGRGVLFDILVSLQNNGKNEGFVKVDDDQIDVIKSHNGGVSKFDLDISFRETGDYLSVRVEYNTDVYAATTIDGLIRHYKNLSGQLVAFPYSSIGSVDYLSGTEKKELLLDFNGNKTEYSTGNTIVDLFKEQVLISADKIAVSCGSIKLTYRQIDEMSNQMAGYLNINYSICPDDLVCIMLDRSEWLIICIIGILKAGGAYVPIDPVYPSERIEFIKQDSQCKVCIDEEILEDFMAGIGLYNKDHVSCLLTDSNLVYVIYTSGSTGKPKGVMMEHRSMVNLMKYQLSEFTPKEVLQFATISFDVSFQEIFSTLLSGATLNLISDDLKKDFIELSNFILQNNIDTVFLPTAYFKVLMELDFFVSRIDPVVKRIIVAGEQLVLGSFISEYLQLERIELFNHYGPAETHVVTSYKVSYVDFAGEKRPPIGKPIFNTSIYILDSNGLLVPKGVPGEIYIGGLNIARGYLNRPDLTSEKFLENHILPGERMYRTGDIGRWLPDGNIEFMGRKDDQVKIRGYRIELGEIETALLSEGTIEEAAVITRETAFHEKELVAYIVSGQKCDVSEVRAYLQGILPEYMLPSRIIQLIHLPLTNNGKVDKRALPIPEERLETDKTYISPKSENELQLANIWSEVLGRNNISMTDNFFELGGHSLKAVQLISKVNKIMGTELMLGYLFLNPTLNLFAENLHHDLLKVTIDISGLVYFNASSNHQTVLILPGVGGVMDEYYELAKEMAKTNRVIGFDYTKLISTYNEIESITDIAVKIKENIVLGDSSYPLHIIGHSFGGIIGFELAKLFEKDKLQLKQLTVLDMLPGFLTPANFNREEVIKDIYELEKNWTFNRKTGTNPDFTMPSELNQLLRHVNTDNEASRLYEFYLFKLKSTVWRHDYYMQGQIVTDFCLLTASKSFFQKDEMLKWKAHAVNIMFKELKANHNSIVKGKSINDIVGFIK